MGLAYKFPTFYRFMDRLFFASNENSPLSPLAIEMMDVESLQTNAIVIDLACGSGTVACWIAQQRKDIHVIGIDLAEDMLEEAKNTANELKLQNVSFICESALTLNNADLLKITESMDQKNNHVEMIVCSYGFSAMPDYKEMFAKTMDLLAPGGRYLIMDLHYSKRNWLTLFMTHCIDNWLWGSNQLNRVWELMPEKLMAFEKREQPMKLYRFIPAVFYVAKGIK